MSDNGWSVISPENRDPLFRITLKAWNSRARGAQKGSPAKRTGHTLRVALQYSQKLPENNGLLRNLACWQTICLSEIIVNRRVLPDIRCRANGSGVNANEKSGQP
jgi:hypothetical protein